MKLNLYKSILLTFIMLMIIGCEQTNSVSESRFQRDTFVQLNTLRDTIEYVGITHNIMLDSFLVNLNRVKNDPNSPTYDNFASYLLTISVPYYQNEGFNITTMIDTSEIEIDTNVTSAYEAGLQDTSLSSNSLAFLSQIDTLISQYCNSTITYSVLEDSLNSIITQASYLSETYEYLIVGIAASVAKNSAYYWGEDGGLDKLDYYLGENSGRFNPKKHFNSPKIQLTAKEQKIMSADITGAITGAINGALWGAKAETLGGPGTSVAGAIAGAIAGGLCSGSMFSLTRGMIDSLNLPWWLEAILEGLLLR